MDPVKVTLSEQELPTHWYNVLADVKVQMYPPLDPATMKPMAPEKLAAIFPMALLEQEMTAERWIPIPDEVREAYLLYRPTPLYRAYRLERALQTPARIYYNWEGVSPAGSHKPNTAIAQAYYNKREGKKRLATETGAGQWGSALAFSCNRFGMECTVYMVRVSYDQKPYRRELMRLWGAEVFPSPSEKTASGRHIMEADPDCPGSLGIAISEAVEDAATHDDTNYSLGSVLNHVLLHQTVVGLETKKKMEKIGVYPDVVVGCVGGGSNFHGLAAPFVADRAAGKSVRIVACEPAACPSLTRGEYTFDFGDTAGLTPLMKMYTLGHDFMPPAIHSGGLRYHGMAPIVSALYHARIIEAVSCHQVPTFESAVRFARTEGIAPAPEAAHAIYAAEQEALRCKAEGKSEVILFNLCGHGHFDMASYQKYFDGQLHNYEYPAEAVARSLAKLPKVE